MHNQQIGLGLHNLRTYFSKTACSQPHLPTQGAFCQVHSIMTDSLIKRLCIHFTMQFLQVAPNMLIISLFGVLIRYFRVMLLPNTKIAGNTPGPPKFHQCCSSSLFLFLFRFIFPLLFFFIDFFLMWTVFNVFIEFVIILPVFYVLFCFGFFLAMRHVRS